MKHLIFTLLMFFLLLYTKAQVKKIYGYVQEVNGGAMQDRNSLPAIKGGTTKVLIDNSRYFVFAAIKKNSLVTFKQIWIKGNVYDFKLDTIKKLPFVLESSNGGEMVVRDTLIRSSKEQIIQLKYLVQTGPAVVTKNARKLVLENNVVISTSYKNHLFYIALQKLSNVKPLFTQ